MSESLNVEWTIDRRPTFRHIVISNSHMFIPPRSDTDFQVQFTELTRGIFNGTVIFGTEIDDDDEFIPFICESTHEITVTSEVKLLTISEEQCECGICYETKSPNHISQLNCSHTFCSECFIEHVNKNKENLCCPFCRENIQYVIFQDDIYNQKFNDIKQ